MAFNNVLLSCISLSPFYITKTLLYPTICSFRYHLSYFPIAYSVSGLLSTLLDGFGLIHILSSIRKHGPPARYAKLRVVHAPGMPGPFFAPPWVRDPDMHHGTCVTQVPWSMPGSLNGVFPWSRWRGKHSRHSQRIHNPCMYLIREPWVKIPTQYLLIGLWELWL